MATANARLEWTLILLGAIFYLFVFPHSIGGDGFVRFNSLLILLREGKISPMLFSYVGPLVSSPLVLFSYLYKDPHWWLSRFNTFVLFFFLWAFSREFVTEWTASTRRRFLLLMMCASMFPKHCTDYYAEVFSSCFAALGMIYFVKNRFKLGALSMLLATWNAPGTAVGAALVCVFFFLRARQWRYLLLIVCIAGGILGENYLRYGEWFPMEYLTAKGDKNLLPYTGGPGFNYPLLFGLISVLFSPGKGLLFFTPGIFLLFSHRFWKIPSLGRDFLTVGTLYLLGMLYTYSRWWSWYGGYFWGPRFYLFASILSVFAILYLGKDSLSGLKERLAVFATTLLSLWVGCQGILYGQDFLEYCYERYDGSDFMCQYVPEFSVLWRFFIVRPTMHGRKIAYFIFFVLVAIVVLRPLVVDLVTQISSLIRKYLATLSREKNIKL